MSRHTVSIPLRWGDMDAFGHVNNVQYFRFAEEARVQMIDAMSEAAGKPLRWMTEGIVVARAEIDYLRPLAYGEGDVRITMWISNVGGSSFTVQYYVHTEDTDDPQAPYALAETTLVVFNLATGTSRRLDDTERALLKDWSSEPAPLASARRAARAGGTTS